MPGIIKGAKMKAIMDIISQMDDMELSRLMPKDEMGMEPMDEEMMMKPEKKGITIMKLEASKKPEMEKEDEMEEEDDSEESIDPLSSLARLKERLKKGRM
jgi:hypothetical protein